MGLLESFANAALDLGLPAVEAWLRGRFGPEARIASLRIEDGLVRIEGAHLPLGGRARLRVREATLSATRGERLASSPALRLRSLVGTLELDDEKAGIGAFAAPVDFTPEPRDDDAWVAGTLSVRGATWTRAHGVGEAPPFDGRARVRVTSESWAIEGGAFAAGRTQIDLDARGATGGGRIDRVRLAVRHARAGHLADAVSALLGRELPSWLETAARAEVDARVDWGAAQGGEAHAALRTDAGSALTLLAHLDTADLRSIEMRGSLCLDDVPWAPLRRLESARSAKLELLAHGTGPQATFTLDAALHGDAAIVGAEGPLGLTVRARAAAGAIQWSASLVGAGRASLRLTSSPGGRGEVRFTDLEPPWVLALAALAGARSTPTLPVALRVSGEVTLGDGAATARLEARTPASRLVLDGLRVRREDLHVEEGTVTGSVDVADARLLDLVPDAVTLGEGAAVRCALVVAGAPTELRARGDLSSERLVVSLASRPDAPPLSLRDVAVEIELSRAGLAWRELAFACEGAQIHGEGAVAFRGADGDAPLLALRTARAPASLLRALARFAGLRLDATRLPPELSTSAEVHVRAGGHVHVEGSLDSAESAIASTWTSSATARSPAASEAAWASATRASSGSSRTRRGRRRATATPRWTRRSPARCRRPSCGVRPARSGSRSRPGRRCRRSCSRRCPRGSTWTARSSGGTGCARASSGAWCRRSGSSAGAARSRVSSCACSSKGRAWASFGCAPASSPNGSTAALAACSASDDGTTGRSSPAGASSWSARGRRGRGGARSRARGRKTARRDPGRCGAAGGPPGRRSAPRRARRRGVRRRGLRRAP